MNTEKQINLKVLIRFGKSPSQALEMFQQVYEDNSMSCICVFEWYKRLKMVNDKVKDDCKSRRLSRAGLRSMSSGLSWCCNDCEVTEWFISSQLDDNLQRYGHCWKVIAYGVLSIQQFLAKRTIFGLEQLPY